jgi:hypothetical protein
LFVCAVVVARSPEPHILLFRRPLGTDPVTGKVNAEQAEAARVAYLREYGLPDTAEHK